MEKVNVVNNRSVNANLKTGELENIPNAGKLIQSLRHLDYNAVSAISDIIDNSIDANASQIWINVIADKEGRVSRVEVIDDGTGMHWEVLNQSLKLGSEVEKNPMCDLGLYGMGLITASISLGRRLEVITKAKDGDIIRGIQDLDTVVERNAFVKIMEKLSSKEADEFSKMVISLEAKHRFEADKNKQYNTLKSATMVSISKIDKCEWNKAKGLSDNLARTIGQVFRKFIQADKCVFYVNGAKVKAIDPVNDYEPTILIEETIKVEDSEISIVVSELKDYGFEINREKGLNITNQGFYVLRNNREIAAGETFSAFTKHNDFNLLRIEFSYPATLDSILNTTFSKQKIKLDQSIKNKVERICNPFIRQVRNHAKQKQKDRRAAKEDFSNIEKHISQKSHLLKTPLAEIEKRGPREDSAGRKRKDKPIEHPRLNITKRKRIDIESLKVRFQTESMGEKAPLYSPDQERDVVIVTWNVDHPFYQEVVSPNSNDPAVFNPLAYLIYCYANAELLCKDNSDSQEIVNNIRWDVGRNLSILLR